MIDELLKFLSQYIPLSLEEVEEIVNLNLIKEYKKGTIILRKGEISDKSYFILRGCIRSYYIIDGEEKTTALYTDNQPFAPQCSITKKPSEHYIICLEDSVLMESTSEIEKSTFEKYPKFESLCRIISEKLLAENQMSYDNYMNLSPEKRYLHLMKTRPNLIQRVPLKYLASYLGIKPESLSRIRKRLLKQSDTD